MTPTPEQIKEWREKFESASTPILSILLHQRNPDGRYRNFSVETEWEGYIRARTEQATEIAELKAKLDEIMPLAKFGAEVLRDSIDFADTDFTDVCTTAAKLNLLTDFGVIPPAIEATIEQLLKEKLPFVCVYDNPASMRRECWQNGHLQASYNWMEFDATGKYPPKVHIGANIGEWKTGQYFGDLRAMEAT